MTRQFVDEEAKRQQVPLSIGLMGPPGGGKTYSALRLATGICRVRGGEPFVIDTERGRSLKYSGSFKFRRVAFDPPFSPDAYLDAIKHCVSRGAGAIVVDSMSDEHEGEGGVLDWHDKELDRMAGNDWSKRERVGQAAWIRPKSSRRALINGIGQIDTPLILCFRAREKVKQVKNDRGKMEPTNIGFQPIAPSEIVHQLDLNCLLPPRAEGVPVWKSEKVGEDFVIKLPEFLKPFISEGQPLSEEMGEAFARWASGENAPPAKKDDPPPPSARPRDQLLSMGEEASTCSMAMLEGFWKSLTKEEKHIVGGAEQLASWKRAAEAAEAGAAA
jgi:hypothetical protein